MPPARKRRRRSRRAFSLVETLVAMMIVAFIALGTALNAQHARLFLNRASEELALSAAFCAAVLGREDGGGGHRMRMEIGGRARWISLTRVDF